MRASLIVPTRNRADRLDALAHQSLPAEQSEILVVDNGSTDGTAERIARWAELRPGLRSVEEPVAGVSRARNAGIAAARGELLAFVDDRWPRDGAACGRARLRLERRPPSWYSHPATWYRDAWPRMPAFVLPGYPDAHVRINLAGRERDGIVDRDDYARACDDIERLLRACRNAATGDPVVRDVRRVRDSDPFDPEGPPPDLAVQLDGADAIEHPDTGAIGPFVATRTGAHTTNGFAYLAGPGIGPGPRGQHAVCDLSATIAALVGAPSMVALDGNAFLSQERLDPVAPR